MNKVEPIMQVPKRLQGKTVDQQILNYYKVQILVTNDKLIILISKVLEVDFFVSSLDAVASL